MRSHGASCMRAFDDAAALGQSNAAARMNEAWAHAWTHSGLLGFQCACARVRGMRGCIKRAPWVEGEEGALGVDERSDGIVDWGRDGHHTQAPPPHIERRF